MKKGASKSVKEEVGYGVSGRCRMRKGAVLASFLNTTLKKGPQVVTRRGIENRCPRADWRMESDAGRRLALVSKKCCWCAKLAWENLVPETEVAAIAAKACAGV